MLVTGLAQTADAAVTDVKELLLPQPPAQTRPEADRLSIILHSTLSTETARAARHKCTATELVPCVQR